VKALQAWDVLADVVGVSGASCRPFAAWPRCLPLIMPVDHGATSLTALSFNFYRALL